MNALATVDLVRFLGAPINVWHILALPDRTRTLCSWEMGLTPYVEERDVDSHVVQLQGRPVCARCRRALR